MLSSYKYVSSLAGLGTVTNCTFTPQLMPSHPWEHTRSRNLANCEALSDNKQTLPLIIPFLDTFLSIEQC